MQAIIAGCGYTGLRVARLWARNGHDVYAMTRSEDKSQALRQMGLRPLILNLASDKAWPVLPDASVVLWSVGFDRTNENREEVWAGGLRRLMHRLPPCSERRWVMTSSTGVYGDAEGGVVTEETPAKPVSEGGIASLQTERVLREMAAPSNHCSILRLAGIYGPGRFLRRLEDLKAGVPIAAAPDEWLNLVHVNDIVRTIDFIAEHPDPPPLMNVVAAEPVTRRQYYSTLAELTGAPAPVFNENSGTRRGRHASGNRQIVSHVRSRLGLSFLYDNCRDGLAQSLAEPQHV